jgi:hypothetical protein
MTTKSFNWLALLGGLAIGAASLAHAQDSGPLIDTLVKKGILNDQEAEDLRMELVKDFGTSSAGKLNLSSALTELKFYGDARVRYEYRSGQAATGGDRLELNRYRYRLRFGFNGKFSDGWFFGTRLETGTGNRSTNVNPGGTGTPFGKGGNNAINVGQAYIGREVGDFVFTAGRVVNPLVTTSMVWDDDINPEGLFEQWKHEDGMFTWMATLGQMVYEGNNGITNNAARGTTRANTFLWAAQGGGKVKFSNGNALQVLPTFYTYSGNANTTYGVLTTPNSATLQPQGLSVVDIPVEYTFTIGSLPAKVWLDYAVNINADDRARAAGLRAFGGEDSAYQLGFGVGQTKAKGDWEAKVFYQAVEAFALDSNLVDSDLFDSRTNMQGAVASFAYVLSNGVTAKFTYATADRMNNNIATFGSGDIANGNNLKDYQLFQADLNVKF